MRSYRATCNKQIPSTGIHYFEITHDRIGKGNYLWTGFFVNWALEGFDLRANTKMYLTFDKRDNAIYCNGNYLHLNDSKTSDINEDGGINEGELITSLVDMDNNLSLKTYIIINIIYSEYKKTNDHLYSIDKLDQESKSINLDFESLLKIGQDQKSFLMLKDSETLQNKATSPTKNLKHK